MTCKYWAYIILLQFYHLSINSGHPGSTQRPEKIGLTARSGQEKQSDCGFAGNSDIYGVGIRIGYYSQALSVWVANYFVLGEAKILRSTNLLFMIAVLIGLFALSRKSPNVYAIEAFLLLQLSFATFYIGVVDWTRYSKKYWRFSPGRNAIMSMTNLSAIGYNAWFWWRGLDKMNETPCGTFAFFFTKVDLFGWYQAMYRALSVPAIIGAVITEVNRSLELLQYWRRRDQDVKELYDSLRASLAAALLSVPSRSRSQSSASRGNCSPVEPAAVGSNSRQNSQGDPTNDLEMAVQTPLPPSPKFEQQHEILSSVHGRSTSDRLCSSLRLPDLIEAEAYAQKVFDVSCARHSAWHYDLHLPFVKVPLQIFIPSVHSPRTLQRRWKAFMSQRPLRLSIVVPLLSHATALNRYPTYGILVMFEKAVVAPEYKSVDSRALQIVLDFELTKMSETTFVWTLLYRACLALLIVIFLVLSIELSIYWNHIRGVASVGQVGQLIPAVIGVGGLVKVLWRWLSSSGVSIEEEDGVTKEVRECAELYAQLKDAIQHDQGS